MSAVGILAYGSLIDDPGEEIARVRVRTIEGVQTPFRIEYARASNSRGGAPTLVPVENGGAQVAARILVLDVAEASAASMLWRRETRLVSSGREYVRPKNPGPSAVLVERIEDLNGIDAVLYTKIAPTIMPLNPEELAKRAIASVGQAPTGKDGISYLIDAKHNGIMTPLTDEYEAEILRLTGSLNLEDAREQLIAGNGN